MPLDMLHRMVEIPKEELRIISLVPSQTELLYALGLTNEIVGQTVFCIHPQDKFKNAIKVGGTKKVKYDIIDSLKPNLIICNKEENTQEIVENLMFKYPVWVSDIVDLNSALAMINGIGSIVDKQIEAQKIADTIKQNFMAMPSFETKSCLYLIWKNPYMAAAKGTFINEMLQYAGYNNVLAAKIRYPEITENDIIELNPQVILLSSEPYPFKEKHIKELQLLLPNSKILLVDGEMFSWYGNRLVNSPQYFKHLRTL